MAESVEAEARPQRAAPVRLGVAASALALVGLSTAAAAAPAITMSPLVNHPDSSVSVSGSDSPAVSDGMVFAGDLDGRCMTMR